MFQLRTYLNKVKILLKATLADYKQNKSHYKFCSIDTKERQFAMLRMYCHMMDKALNNPSFEKGHSMKVHNEARCLSEKLKKIIQVTRRSCELKIFWNILKKPKIMVFPI